MTNMMENEAMTMTMGMEFETEMEMGVNMEANMVETMVEENIENNNIVESDAEYNVASSIEKKNISWSCKQIAKMVKNGVMNFDHIVQRSYVWEKMRKTGLIESIILGFPVPPVWARQRFDEAVNGRSNKIYIVLDGKQRLSTIAEFINDEFELGKIKPIKYETDDGEFKVVDITGKTYSELPEELRDIIKDTCLSVNYFDGLSADEERELFKRLNSGKPLSTKSKLIANCKDIVGMLDIGSHQLFNEMLTERAKANKNQITLVMKAWCMLNKPVDEISFDSKYFHPLVEETNISDNEKMELNKVFDTFVTLHTIVTERGRKKVAKKLYTETHFVSLVPFVKKAIDDSLDMELVADFIIDFFETEKGTSNSEAYNDACAGGTGKNFTIVGRHDALKDVFDDFFTEEVDMENEN